MTGPHGWRGLGLATLAALAATATTAHAQDAPAWLQAAAAVVVPTYGVEVHSVVLVDDGTTTLAGDGRVTRELRFAVRILDPDGAARAVARLGYSTDVSNVRDLKAWHIPPRGKVKVYGKSDVLDVAAVGNDVYNEARTRIVSAAADVVPGSVFGFEAVLEERELFNDDVWSFQGQEPVVQSRYTLALPAGWRVEAAIVNHAAVAPQVDGSRFVWELRDLPPIKQEKAAPPISSLAPWLNVRYFPPAGGPASGAASFEDWSDLARWVTSLVDPQSAPNEAVAAKARELTQGAPGDWQRLSAVARFVQSINYISIQIGLGRLRPHAASEVLAKLYGDCKDKASLMVALLKTLGIRAYLVLVNAYDPDFVRPDWPSPRQFNHMIVAIQMRTAGAQGAVLKHDKLGELLLFDPTDPHTPLGGLPESEQSGWALLAAGSEGGLVRVPDLPAAANRVERELDVTLAGTGAAEVNVTETSWGQAGVEERSVLSGAAGDYTHRIERWLAASSAGVKTAEIRPTDRLAEDRFDLTVRFTAPAYSQLMQNRMLVFRPVFLSRRDFVYLTEPKRVHPIRIGAEEFVETTTITLPAGFAVDEVPAPVAVEAPFGSYVLKVEMHGEQLSVARRMSLRRTRVPPSEYAVVRGFFEQVAAAEQASVVLLRR